MQMACKRSGKGDEQNLDNPINFMINFYHLHSSSIHPVIWEMEYSWIWNWHTPNKSSTSYLHNMHSIPGLYRNHVWSTFIHLSQTNNSCKKIRIWFSAYASPVPMEQKSPLFRPGHTGGAAGGPACFAAKSKGDVNEDKWRLLMFEQVRPSE